MKYTKSVDFAFKELGTTIEFKVIVNSDDEKEILDLMQEGWNITRCYGK